MDSFITYNDVELETGSFIYNLRQIQNKIIIPNMVIDNEKY